MSGRTCVAALLAGVLLVLTGCTGDGETTSASKRTLPVALPAVALDGFDGGPKQALDGLSGPMVINLWASWCAPCREELPILEAFSNQHGDQVEMVGVDFQDPQTAAATKLVAESKVTYRLFSDPDGLMAQAPLPRVPALPFMLFVDEQGQVVAWELTEVTTLAEMEDLVTEHLDISLEDPALEDPALEDPALEDPALEDPA